MIIIFLIVDVISSLPEPTFTKNQEISLYPTEGEIYEYYLDSFLSSTQLMCKIDTQVPNVQLLNQYQEIYQIQGDQFISMSSNDTHFGTLSNENEVIIYEWKNQMLQYVGSPVTIDSSFKCFSINLSHNFSILLDCYQNNEFFLIQLMDEQSKIAYSIQSSIPTSTKIQSIVNGTNAFIVYAQYFENYSILSLFSQQFFNQSSINQQFIDFDITITISPNIYIITTLEIFQLSISPDSHFYSISNVSFENTCQFCQYNVTNFTSISVYTDLLIYSQCDQIQLIFYIPNSQVCINYLLGCKDQIIMNQQRCNLLTETILKILQNNQFIIYQLNNNKISIQEKLSNKMVVNALYCQNNSLLYFNSDTVEKVILLQINKKLQIKPNSHQEKNICCQKTYKVLGNLMSILQ